jgi:uroporphyrinogen-III synthase
MGPQAEGTTPPGAGGAVAVTADRRREDQAVMLERLGLEVRMYPLLRTEAGDVAALEAVTRRLAGRPPDYLVANTGYGMRTWLELAASWGLRDALVSSLKSGTAIAARGAKALGEVRRAGLDAWYKAPSETLQEVLDRLMAEELAGRSVAVQHHGGGDEVARCSQALEAAGASVIAVPVYRTGANSAEVAQALARAVVAGEVAAVTFTAAPQVEALAAGAASLGVSAQMADRFNSGAVVAACIGEVCAGAARRAGIQAPLVPDHPRLGALATAVARRLSA